VTTNDQETAEDLRRHLRGSRARHIDWHDVESLLLALGAELSEGRGSRLRVALNDVREVFHRPHPQNEAGKPMVRELRRFLIAAGIRPPEEENDE
jgi:HicA toxin of bacterial toxin-antitoxin,